jgi:hypothetical protein
MPAEDQWLRDLYKAVDEQFPISAEEGIAYDDLRQVLAKHIAHLLDKDFQRLISILYRIDVSEEKLKDQLAKNTGRDAAIIISDLIMERMLQKIKTRQQYKRQS